MLNNLLGNKNKITQSFSYFVPSPPTRKSGYRERELDEILNKLLMHDIEIKHTNTQAAEKGMWFNIIYSTHPKNIDLIEKKLEQSSNSLFTEKTTQIEDIYYEDETEI